MGQSPLGGDSCQTREASSTRLRMWGMLRPPGLPIARTGRPALNTIIGAMEDTGRRPGQRRFATGWPSIEGWKEKSVS